MMTEQKQVIPEGYKKTEVGIIPIDWNICTLGDLSERITVGIASSATHAYRMKGIPFLRNQNIKPNRLDTSDVLFISEEYESNFINKRLRTGDLLTARTGYPGTTCVVPEEFNGAQSFTTLITRLKNEVVVSSYLTFYINSEKGQDFFTQNQIGGGQKNVNAATLKQLIVVLPSQEEQTAIANALSDVDALISELEKLIAKKQAIKTATMQQLLTGKTRLPEFALREDGTPKGYKQSELGEIPEDWEYCSLNDIIDFCSSGATPYRGNKQFYKGNIRWITSGELNYCVINDTIEKITTEAVKRTNLKIHPKGTFLMAITGLEAAGTRGACGIVGKPSTTNQSCMAIYPNEKLNTNYFYHWYVYNGDDLAFKYCQGTKQLSYTAGLIRKIPIYLPKNLKEQLSIAEIITDIDDEILAFNEQLQKTRQIKQGMMQELLTGKTRLVKPAREECEHG